MKSTRLYNELTKTKLWTIINFKQISHCNCYAYSINADVFDQKKKTSDYIAFSTECRPVLPARYEVNKMTVQYFLVETTRALVSTLRRLARLRAQATQKNAVYRVGLAELLANWRMAASRSTHKERERLHAPSWSNKRSTWLDLTVSNEQRKPREPPADDALDAARPARTCRNRSSTASSSYTQLAKPHSVSPITK